MCHSMTLAEAKAILPSLRLEPHDARANLGTLMELAGWAQAFSPMVQPEAPDTLLLDVTGCERLFRGEPNLLSQALAGLRGKGFSARGAIADTPGTAWAIAHAHHQAALVTHTGRDVEAIARLPVSSLRIDRQTVQALHVVGVETINALMSLPRASMRARFGDRLLHRLDQVLDNVPEPLAPFQAPPVLRSHLRLGAATDRWDIIQRATEHVLAQFCEQLARRMLGVTRLCVTLYCPGASPTTLSVTVSVPTRSLKRLQNLLSTRLEQVRLPAATDCIIVWARQLEPLDDWQDELFDTRGSHDRELAELVDRLSVRLGSESVGRVALVSDHQPERAFEYVPWGGTGEGTKGKRGTKGRRDGGTKGKKGTKGQRDGGTKGRKGTEARRHEGTEENNPQSSIVNPQSAGTKGIGARPLRVWCRPMEVPVVAATSDGRPVMFRFKSVEHTVVACTGPERLETGWWRGPHVQRDYFRVVSRSGEAFWLFRSRDSGKWYVHGTFD